MISSDFYIHKYFEQHATLGRTGQSVPFRCAKKVASDSPGLVDFAIGLYC